LLAARIEAALNERRAVLAQLVAQAVEARLASLVEEQVEAELERLAERVNGANTSGVRAGAEMKVLRASTSKPCRVCGERPAQRHRTTCSRCRHEGERARARERRQDAAVGAPVADTDDEGRPGEQEPVPAAEGRRRAAVASNGNGRVQSDFYEHDGGPGLSAPELRRWLVSAGLAVEAGEALLPTSRGTELAEGLHEAHEGAFA
jgi:hypothetical protein